MKPDLELEGWREEWQSHTTIPSDLRRSVERHSLLMRIGLIGDVMVTLVVGGGTTLWALRSGDPDMIPVAIAAAIFLALAWIFVLVANRGLWSPSAIDASTFVNLSIRRCRTALFTTWFAIALFFAEVVFGLWWSFIHLSSSRTTLLRWLLFSSPRIDIVWAVTIAFMAGVIWYRGRKKAEMSRLLELRSEIIDTASDPRLR